MANKYVPSLAHLGEINYDEVPRHFALCMETECPQASHCLRRRVWTVMPDTAIRISIINPTLTLSSENCPYFRSDRPVLCGRGFKNMQANMLPAQYKFFSEQLKAHFGRNPYFERRRGETLCSVRDVAFIRSVLATLKLDAMEFDSYEERYNWSD